MRDITVLLSASGSPSMPGIIDCFKKNGERNIKVIGIDAAKEPSARHLVDKFYEVPIVTDENYCEIVLEICKKEKVDIYFPNISAEVTIVTKRKREFLEQGTIISAPNNDFVGIINNKLKLYEYLECHGITVPKYYGVNSVQDFVIGCQKLGYPKNPVCLKIVDGSGSRGVRIIDSSRNRYQIFVNEKPNSFFVSYDDMLSILGEADVLHEMLLVEYMPGNEYTVDLLAENGTIKYVVGRENVVSLMSIAQESIVSEDLSAYKISEEIVKVLNLDGNIGFDFMRDESGKAVLMDLNPRITATVSVIAAAGVNLPYLRVKQLLKENMPEDISIAYGTRLKRRYGEIYTNPNGEEVSIG